MGQLTRLQFRGLAQKFNFWLLGVPVFVKVMGIALGMAVVLGGGMLWQIHQTWHTHRLHELEQRGRKLGKEISTHCAGLSRAGSFPEISAELRHSVAEAPDLAYLILQDAQGRVLADACDPEAAPGGPDTREVTLGFADTPHVLRVGMSVAHIDQEVAWLTRRLARTTAIITLLGMAAAWCLTRIFARPIEELAGLTRAVKAGNYQVQAPVRARDEVGELADAFNQMTTAIAQKEAARQQLLRRVIEAGEEERKRLARELHDDTGQALTSQIAALSALEKQCPAEKMGHRLSELRQQAEQMLAGVHDLAVALRPSVLDDVGLRAALDRHCRMFAERSGVQITFADLDLGDQRLPPEVELTIYRVVQEALTNAVRHGQPTHVLTLLQRTRTGLLAIVRDNGCGFDAEHWHTRCLQGDHLGLLGIEERVTLVGGSFCVDSLAGKGAAVYADVPLPQPI